LKISLLKCLLSLKKSVLILNDLSMKKLTHTLFRNTLFAVLLNAAMLASAEDASTWQQQGQQALKQALSMQANTKKAKNVILFVGDGMGMSTITAARIFAGQAKGLRGEGHQLSFEKFPYLALSKTYSADQQTPDSAPTMSSMMTGVKTNHGMLSVSQSVKPKEKNVALVQQGSMETLLESAEKKGLATGIVTTTRITHATPAATYAHTSNRNWENDGQLPKQTALADIAAQLIAHYPSKDGDGIEVVLGGGRKNFLPVTTPDPEYRDKKGKRKDGRNLITEYKAKTGADYVWNKAQFDAIDPAKTTRLLGLFERSHLKYEADRNKDTAGEPSLAEMTSKAIDILANNQNGYFLMVEAGRIDHAHHAGNAYRALKDTAMLSDAVEIAASKVNLAETLIIVTADHSHTFIISGYPERGNPILGKVKAPGADKFAKAADGKPYTTLGYHNGMGYHAHNDDDETPDHRDRNSKPQVGRVKDLTNVDTTLPNYHQEAVVPLQSETHAGEDVPIYAIGPQAHLFHGTQEQTFIYYVMRHALGLDK